METQTLLSQGNAAFRQQNYEEALYCYERAQRQAPDALKASLNFNREFAERRLREKLGGEAQTILERIQARLQLEDEINVVRPHFDSEFYLAQNPDVAQAGIDSVEHYCGTGWREGRDPHPEFSTRYYLEAYPDVHKVKMNPFLHYLISGRSEGRRGFLDFSQLMIKSKNVTNLGGYLWKSLNEDPHFYLDANKLCPTSGWYLISMDIAPTKNLDVTKIYIDIGSGYSEELCSSIVVETQSPVEKVIHFDTIPIGLRLDPQESDGVMQIKKFVMRQISSETGKNLMLRRLERCGHMLDDLLDKGLKELKSLYDLTFGNTSSIEYNEWIKKIESTTLPTDEEVQSAIEKMGNEAPLISIVMPVYNTPETYLRECIGSVLVQSYPNWQLCIADDNSNKPHIKEILKEYADMDSRMVVIFREKNGHISQASNSALQMSSGEFVALLDHDDMLPKHALYFVALAVHAQQDAQIIYSDEDKLDRQGHRVAPHFKSDWNPDLLYSQNYISHLGVYRRELLMNIGGFRTGVEGSQDYDLLLRCLRHIKPNQIVHIPRVLYHWRTAEGSTALASGEKSYTTEAGIKALKDYFGEVDPRVTVEAGLLPNTYRLRWPIPEREPLVSLLIPTRDGKELIETCVRSILNKTTYKNYEILILDNGSVELETLAFFNQIQQEEPRVRVIRYDYPFNYSAINNFGARHANGDILGLINNDIEVISHEWLGEMVSHVLRTEIGCVGAKLYYSNDTIQHAGVVLGIGGVANHSHKNFPRKHPGYFARLICTQNCSAVTAACLLVRRSTYDEVFGLDEINLKVAFNDVDFNLKVREAGYRNIWTPYAELYHHESVSRGAEDTPEKKKRFNDEVKFMQQKWGGILDMDPYYSPNLTKHREDFSMSNK
jgi:glycosyltransferase involved in cell wall biosynthesis